MRHISRFGVPVLTICTLLVGAQHAVAQESDVAAVETTGGASVLAPSGAAQQPQTFAIASPEHNTEISFFLGGLVGGDLPSVLSGDFSLRRTLENGRTYGGRVGYYSWPLGVEGSFAYSNSGLAAQATLPDVSFTLGARVMYTEANVLLLILPGPIQPFVTGGGGLHSFKLSDLQGVEINKWGWNFGAGLKINISRVSLRADVRDHLTRFAASDLSLDPALADLLGISDQDIHNVEISFGLGFSF